MSVRIPILLSVILTMKLSNTRQFSYCLGDTYKESKVMMDPKFKIISGLSGVWEGVVLGKYTWELCFKKVFKFSELESPGVRI